MKFPHWSPEEIGRISTHQIFLMLAALGIPVTVEDFLEDVAKCYGGGDIYKEWQHRFTIMADGRDEDFPWMAADVLWRRLAPGKISTEQLDDMVQEGYDLTETGDAQGCLLWLDVWEALKPRFTQAMRKIEDAESVLEGVQVLFNWCQDVEMELAAAAIEDETFHDRRIRYCREICAFFPESQSIVPHMKRAVAESLYLSGRKVEAEREFHTLVTTDPDDPWNYIMWGDMYAEGDRKTSNPKRAEELYRKALGIDSLEDGIILERIEGLHNALKKRRDS